MGRMLDHISLGANDMQVSRRFYDAVMKVLGFRCLKEIKDQKGALVGLGYGEKNPFFWINTPLDDGPAAAGNGIHIAFRADSRQVVHDFHAVALAHGGQDDGAPGLRPEYHEQYYAAFVRDPAGHKIEIVFGNS